jgi:hypothetical protein
MVALLFLLARADVYGWFFCIALSAATLAAFVIDARSGEKWSVGPAGVAVGFCVVVVGLLLSVLWCVPPKDGGWFTAWVFSPSIERLMLTIYAFVFELNFGPPIAYLPGTLLCLLITTLALARKRRACTAWIVFVFSLFVFYYVKFLPRFWHKGMVIVFIAGCAWLAFYEADKPFKSKWIDKLTLFSGRCFGPMIAIVLVFYVIYGLKWISSDILRPYSAAQPVARFIMDNSLEHLMVAGDPDFSAQGVSAYLDRPLYYPASNSFGRYVVWNNRRHWPLNDGELTREVSSLAEKHGDEVLLVVGYELSAVDCKKLGAQLLVSYPRTVKSEEEMWLYRVSGRVAGSR